MTLFLHQNHRLPHPRPQPRPVVGVHRAKGGAPPAVHVHRPTLEPSLAPAAVDEARPRDPVRYRQSRAVAVRRRRVQPHLEGHESGDAGAARV